MMGSSDLSFVLEIGFTGKAAYAGDRSWYLDAWFDISLSCGIVSLGGRIFGFAVGMDFVW